MEDILKALMQSAASQQQAQQQPQQPAGGSDAMAQMLGGMLGGGQQSSTGSAGADAMSQMLGGMLGGGQTQGGAGGDLISQAIGGLLGGQQSGGGAGAGALLGGLQQIIGGTPGAGQLPMGGSSAAMTSSNPIMLLLQPVINKLAAKLGISPQMATIISSIALHYLVQSSPNTPGASPLNLGSVMQALASGRSISPTALQQSGMVNDVMQATGMTEQQAVKSLNTTFNVMGSQLAPVKKVRGAKGLKSARGVRSKATLKRRRG
jgi:hypothetical protein